MKRRILCAILAVCFVFSLSATAFAENYDSTSALTDSTNEAMDEGSGYVTAPKYAAAGEQTPAYSAGHFTTTADFVADTVKSAYMDRMISYYIENGNLQSTLSAGQPVLMFFEGASDIGKCEVDGERTGAVCLVIRNDGRENYIAYYCKLCDTLPDYPFGYSYDNGHDNYGAATLIDGIYSLYTVNHRGIYAGFNTRTGSNQCVPCVYMNSDGSFSVLNGNGINVHTRLSASVSGDEKSPYSAGCLCIAGGQPYDAYLEFLQQAVPDTTGLTDTKFGGGDIKKYNTSVTPEDTVAGKLVMDRYLAKDAMSALYGGNKEAIACITEYSSTAQADEAAGSTCIANCTVYPSYLSAEVKEGTALMSLPQNGTPAAEADGNALTVTALYENADGEYWYRVYYKGSTYFVNASDVGDTTCIFDDVSIHNYNYPVVKQYKKAFSVWGIVGARYNKLKSVNGYINSSTGTNECTKSVTNILRSYSLDSSDGWTAYRYSLDNLMAFSGLSIGEHQYKISATVDNYYVSDDGIKAETKEIVLVDKTFRVATKVTFDANGGTVEPETQFTDENGCLTDLPVPVKDKFVFTEWQDASGNTVTTETKFAANDTVTAQWKSLAILSSDETECSADAGDSVSFAVTLTDADGAPIVGAAVTDEATGETQLTDADGAASFTCTAEEGSQTHDLSYAGDDTFAKATLTINVTGEKTEIPVPSDEPEQPDVDDGQNDTEKSVDTGYNTGDSMHPALFVLIAIASVLCLALTRKKNEA